MDIANAIKETRILAWDSNGFLVKVEDRFFCIGRESIGIFEKEQGEGNSHTRLKIVEPEFIWRKPFEFTFDNLINKTCPASRYVWKYNYKTAKENIRFLFTDIQNYAYEEKRTIPDITIYNFDTKKYYPRYCSVLVPSVYNGWDKSKVELKIFKNRRKIAVFDLSEPKKGNLQAKILKRRTRAEISAFCLRRNIAVYKAIKEIIGVGVFSLPDIRRKIGQRGSKNYEKIRAVDGREHNVFDYYSGPGGIGGWDAFCSSVGIKTLHDGRNLYFVIK